MEKHCSIGFAGLVVALASLHATPSHAAPELITNGGFEVTSATNSQQITTTNISGWSSSGYNFIYLADPTSASGSTADTTGATGSYGNVKLWGPGDGRANGLITSPSGGNFIAADNNFGQGAVSQVVGNLVAGQAYTLAFYWAAAQQYGYSGANQEQWQVTFGNQTQTTNLMNLASNDFSGWKAVTMTFVASSATQTLSFLAQGAPNGNPPFSLLDGVSLMAVSEPGSWSLIAAGVFCLGGWTFYRRRSRA